jgi:hypothetical protein
MVTFGRRKIGVQFALGFFCHHAANSPQKKNTSATHYLSSVFFLAKFDQFLTKKLGFLLQI